MFCWDSDAPSTTSPIPAEESSSSELNSNYNIQKWAPFSVAYKIEELPTNTTAQLFGFK